MCIYIYIEREREIDIDRERERDDFSFRPRCHLGVNHDDGERQHSGLIG